MIDVRAGIKNVKLSLKTVPVRFGNTHLTTFVRHDMLAQTHENAWALRSHPRSR
jgi:hypothetical protein